jgi:hypothetical protein
MGLDEPLTAALDIPAAKSLATFALAQHGRALKKIGQLSPVERGGQRCISLEVLQLEPPESRRWTTWRSHDRMQCMGNRAKGISSSTPGMGSTCPEGPRLKQARCWKTNSNIMASMFWGPRKRTIHICFLITDNTNDIVSIHYEDARRDETVHTFPFKTPNSNAA